MSLLIIFFINDFLSSALLNKGYKVSASHAMAGSVKTDAPMDVIWDVMRSWVSRVINLA